MNALNSAEVLHIKRISDNHASYREAIKTPGTDYASWAGVFEVNVAELLEIIDRLTRP